MSRTINTTINGPLFLLPTDNPLTITASGGVNATATDAIDGDFEHGLGDLQRRNDLVGVRLRRVPRRRGQLRDQLCWRVDLGDRSDWF